MKIFAYSFYLWNNFWMKSILKCFGRGIMGNFIALHNYFHVDFPNK